MVTAKLLVAAGAPLQFSSGEMSLPVQPKLLKTCSAPIVAPFLISGLVNLKPDALVALVAAMAARPKAAAKHPVVSFILFLLVSRRRRWTRHRPLALNVFARLEPASQRLCE